MLTQPPHLLIGFVDSLLFLLCSVIMLSTNVDVERQNVRCGQKDGLSAAKEARGRAAMSFNKKRQSGRWGVVQGCNCHSILNAIATLIEAQRLGLAMLLVAQELNCQT